MTQAELREALISALIPAWTWQLPDATYETVSGDWVEANWRAWLDARPAELCVFELIGTLHRRARPLWIADACDCDDLSLGTVAHAQVGNALTAQKTLLPRGGLAFGFLYYVAGPARLENFQVEGSHSINWFLDHDRALRFFEPGIGVAVELTPEERSTACFGLAA